MVMAPPAPRPEPDNNSSWLCHWSKAVTPRKIAAATTMVPPPSIKNRLRCWRCICLLICSSWREYHWRSLPPSCSRRKMSCTITGNSGRACHHLGNSGVGVVEVTGHGVDKSTGLSHLCDRWGISAREVVAFGDNHNDVGMLLWAGHGVAMGNAADSAIEVADEVIGDHRDDAVAVYIESIVEGL